MDFHPEFQQIASVDTDTGEFQEKRLAHREGAVGMEASGHARWFERLMAELQFELWIGDAAEIRTKRARKQKTDRHRSSPNRSVSDLQLFRSRLPLQ